jgi:hypothetical protein
MANVLAFLSGHCRRDWSQHELAEFYRVERALIQAGLRVSTDRGLSDEGDPWFVFCRADDGEVVVHFARIDGRYVVGGPAYEGTVCGADIRSIATDLVGRHPLMQRRLPQDNNVILHPAALLVAIVAVALLKSSEAQAHSNSEAQAHSSSDVPLFAAGKIPEAADEKSTNTNTSEMVHSSILDARHVAVIISAAMIAIGLTSDSHQGARNELVSLASLPVDSDVSAEASPAELVSSFQLSQVLNERGTGGDNQDLDVDADVNGPPSITAEQTVDLLSFIAVLNDVAVPGHVIEALQGQTIAEFFGSSAAQTWADAVFTLEEQTRPSPSAIVELELEDSAALPEVRSLTFTGPDQISYTGEFEIVSALPSNLQPYLAQGLTLEAASSSAADVLTALNFDPVQAVSGLSDPDENLTPLLPPVPDVVVAGSELHAVGGVALDTIVHYIEDFIAQADRFKVFLSDGDVIFYDLVTVTTVDPSSLDSITWEFADGTSISLIGSAADLPHDLAA